MSDEKMNSPSTTSATPTPTPTSTAGLSGAGTPQDTMGTTSMGRSASPGAGSTGGSAGAMGAPSSRADSDATAAAMASSTGSSSASGSSGSKSASDMARETSDAARSRAQELGQSARSEAASMADKGRSMAYAKAEEAMERGASEVDTTAEHIRAAGREFGEGSYPAQAADYLATSLSDAANALRTQDIDGMMSEVTAFARRNPALFIGGAALLGFVGARMLKASERAGGGDRWRDDARRYDAPPPGVAGTPYATNTPYATGTGGMGSPRDRGYS